MVWLNVYVTTVDIRQIWLCDKMTAYYFVVHTRQG